MSESSNHALQAWVVAADMGLGHKRAVYPFASIAYNGIIIANFETFAPPDELKIWNKQKKIYESLSRIKSLPIFGNFLFGLMDRLQAIRPAYPRRDLSFPTFQTRLVSRFIRKGMGKKLIETIVSKPLPVISSFFLTTMALDYAGISRNYCIICDADINRVWVAEHPRESKVIYCVPCGMALRRLRQYGVPDERIFITGFPLPLELLGDTSLDVLRHDLAQRLKMLDPCNRFMPLHGKNVEHFLEKPLPNSTRQLTITFAVGGAGAQKEIGVTILKSLQRKLLAGECRLNLVCGIRKEVADYFAKAKEELLPDCTSVSVIWGATDSEYFSRFNECLHATDILWTKPSELSFYVGLGIPIIAAPCVGAQEEFNLRWLEDIQAVIKQHDPAFTHEWLFEYLNDGRFAEAAWSGFLKARKYGTYKILELLETETITNEDSVLKR